MPVWSIVLLVIIAILVVAFNSSYLLLVTSFVRSRQKNQAQIDAAKTDYVYVDYRQEENET